MTPKVPLWVFLSANALFFGFAVLSVIEKHDYKDTIEELKSSNTDLLRYYTVEKARSTELEKRALDRDALERDLRTCLIDQTKHVGWIEDCKWQMDLMIKTCPGRARPPKLPRP